MTANMSTLGPRARAGFALFAIVLTLTRALVASQDVREGEDRASGDVAQIPSLPPGALRLVSHVRHGDRLAFCAQEPGAPVEWAGRLIPRTRVWVHDGITTRQMGTAPGTCDPAWSADGERVAVVAPDGLWVFSADLRETMHLVDTRNPEPRAGDTIYRALSDPAWAPRGDRLAYRVRIDSTSWVEVVDTRTGQIVHTSGDVDDFVWGADSRSLRFGERVISVP